MKSLSTGALRNAAVIKLSHMPKRATQHGVFTAGYETLPAQLKPGQVELERQVYTEEAKLLEKTYIQADLAAQSTYQQGLTSNPSDYRNPTKPIKPGQPAEGSGHHKVSHWASTSKSAHNADAVHGAVYHRQNGPSYQAVNPPTCVGGNIVQSSYCEDYGAYGSNPCHKVVRSSPSMPVFKTALTRGTPKATLHMPGYQGYLPAVTANPYVARVEAGASLRSMDKSNLTEQFHQNIPSYSGHIPICPMNDKGRVNIGTITEMGRSFRNHSGSGLNS